MIKIENQIIEILSNNSNCQAKVESLLNLKELPSKFLVKFCLEINKPLDELYDVKENSKVYQARQNCLRLTESWLANPNSVSVKELEAAAEAAYWAAGAAKAAYCAAGAAYRAAEAAYRAAEAAGAAEAVYWAAGAARAAYRAAGAAEAAYRAAWAARAAEAAEAVYRAAYRAARAASAAGTAYCAAGAAEAGFSYEQSYKILLKLLTEYYTFNELETKLYL